MNAQQLMKSAAKFWQEGNVKAAREAYGRVIAIEPKNYRSLNNLASIEFVSKNYVKAEALFKQAIVVAPDLSEAYINLGNIYSMTDQVALYSMTDQVVLAIRTFSTVIKIEPNNYIAYHQLGLCFLKLNELNNAFNSINVAINLSPRNPELFILLGKIFEAKDMLNEAINAYEQALKIQPSHLSALTSLGEAYLYRGEKSKSSTIYEAALSYYPNDMGIYYFLCTSDLSDKYLTSELQLKVDAVLTSKDESSSTVCKALFIKALFAQQNCDFIKEMELLSQAHCRFLESKKFQKESGYYLNDLQLYANKMPYGFRRDSIGQISRNDMSPIFIVGAPRSGSTLIENIICAADEAIKKGEETCLINNELFKLLKLAPEPKSFHQLGVNILARYEEKKLLNCERFTDKSLENIFMVGFILEVFPNARIVYCKRKPISSVISILQNNLGSLSWAHKLDDIFKYLECSSQAYTYWKSEYPDSITEVDYDLLVTNQINESKKLLEFCNIPWTEECLNFHKKKNIVSKTASVNQIRNPIHADSVDKFKQYESFFSPYSKPLKS